nr:small GTPase LIP1 isoform X3 [Arachis hypogaea]
MVVPHLARSEWPLLVTQHTYYGNSGTSSSSLAGDSKRDFFVEFWDVSGHDRYKDCRSLFYSQINGVIFVHDLSQRRTKSSLQKWAAEISATGTFSAPSGSLGPSGLPVPYIVIGNKSDIAAKEGTRGSSGNLVDVARQWVEKQGLLPSSEDLPLTESFPGGGSLIAKYSCFPDVPYNCYLIHSSLTSWDLLCWTSVGSKRSKLIRRRYFSDELPAPSWSVSPVQRNTQRIDEDDHSYTTSLSSDPYNTYNMLPPLPAQRNLTPPPTLYPQWPVSVSENHSFPRFSLSDSSENTAATRTKRSYINV